MAVIADDSGKEIMVIRFIRKISPPSPVSSKKITSSSGVTDRQSSRHRAGGGWEGVRSGGNEEKTNQVYSLLII